MKQPVNDNVVPPDEPNAEGAETLSRRRLLKALAATGGAVAGASLLPGEWVKPVIEAGVLPAHAQVTPEPQPTEPPLGTGDLQVTLTWNTGFGGCEPNPTGSTDVDLHVVEPSGTVIFYANPIGDTGELDVDNTDGCGPENIFVPAGAAAPGTYQVMVNYYSGEPVTTATIRITVFDGTPQEQQQTFTRVFEVSDFCSGQRVANVVFPAGSITETPGAVDVCALGVPIPGTKN
jgi:hypothetical protein